MRYQVEFTHLEEVEADTAEEAVKKAKTYMINAMSPADLHGVARALPAEEEDLEEAPSLDPAPWKGEFPSE